MKSIPLLMNEILIKCPRVNVWSKSMLSVISSKKSCLIEAMLASSSNIRMEAILSEES